MQQLNELFCKLFEWVYLRVYYCIWLTSAKRKENVDGHEIEFISLPRWLMVGGARSKTWFIDGMCVTHPTSRTTMIFLSKRTTRSKSFRYTLYHEYWESLSRYGQTPPGTTHEEIQYLLREGYVSWEKDVPDLEEILTISIEDRGQSTAHIRALIMELALARKEMKPSDFAELLDETMKNRL